VESCESFFTPGLLSGKRILITGGPTREAIDPVRFISNHSSGKMAYALANEAVAAGAQVTLISGPVNLSTPERVTKVDVITANEMRNACLQHYKDCDVFIGVAAVADYRPADVNDEKIKKTEDELQIRLIKNPDIISEIASQDDRPFVVGFAAETTDVIEYGRDKLKRKNLDLLFANHATDTFNSDSVTATAIHNDGERNLGSGNKNHMARQMLKMISEQLVQSKD
jgi:phosphopantothenoylcysteine decarboxylase/phosphopantothenate--cysteine ligase